MLRPTCVLLIVSCVAIAAGCDSGPAPDVDVGSTEPDAGGGTEDSGTLPDVDAATLPDVDSGRVATDAGLEGCATGGACPTGFTCTAAGYCASATGVPAFDHVYVAIFENRSLSSVEGNAPYLDGLAASYVHATHYGSVAHPSLPNYLAMTGGDVFGVGCDCHPGATNDCTSLTCNLLVSSCNCEQDVTHLGDQLDAVGVRWREYGEGMGTPCNGTDSRTDHYAAKHLPFLYYANVLTDAARCADSVRDYGDFAADLAARSVRFAMISPDLCNDMHDTCGGNAITHGDDWARTNLEPIISALGPNDALFIVWDEQDSSLGTAPIPFIVVSPLVRAGAVTDATIDHYSLLATWEDGFGTLRLGNAVGRAPIADIWR